MAGRKAPKSASLLTFVFILPDQFQKHGITHFQLVAEDFKTLPLEKILQAVEHLHALLQKGIKVYVHCKAGRGRSALIIMCYLIKYHGISAKEAFDLVRQQRKQAGFSEKDAKWASLKEFEAKYTSKKITT